MEATQNGCSDNFFFNLTSIVWLFLNLSFNNTFFLSWILVVIQFPTDIIVDIGFVEFVWFKKPIAKNSEP